MLVLFDLDGTLMRGKGLGRPTTEATIRDVFNLDISLENHWFGGKTDWFSLIELLTPHGITETEIQSRLPDYMTAKLSHMSRLLETIPMWAIPGAMEAVESLRSRADAHLGVLTGNVESTALFKLKAVGFEPDWFPVRAFGHEAIHRNDLPPLALKRAETLHQRPFAAEEVWIIGDTVADVECARAHHLNVVAVTTGFQSRDDLAAAGPDYLIDNLSELQGILR